MLLHPIPKYGPYFEIVGTTMSYLPSLSRTMWKKLEGRQESESRFRAVYLSQLEIDRPNGYSGPDYKVYEFMDR